MLIIFLCKLHHAEGLTALPATFNDNGLMIILLFPSQESLFNFPFQHKHLIINILQMHKTIFQGTFQESTPIFQGTFQEPTPIFQGTFIGKDNKIKESLYGGKGFLTII